MSRFFIVIIALLLSCGTLIHAKETVFVESGDEMVKQMLGGEKKYSLTRSFMVVEEEMRGISIRARNQQGEEETVAVSVPVDGGETAARLKVEFDINSAILRPSAYPLLAELGRALQDERVAERRVCIKGHTDSDGEDEYNLKLSFDRAGSVLAYLQGAIGLSVETLQVFGYGENMPLVPNDSRENKQVNRRVEVSLSCPEVN